MFLKCVFIKGEGKMKRFKKNLCLIIAVVMIVALLPAGIGVKAEDTDIYMNCGKGLEEFGTLNEEDLGDFRENKDIKYLELGVTSAIIDGKEIVSGEDKVIGTAIWIDNNRNGIIDEGDRAVKLREDGMDKDSLQTFEDGVSYYDLSEYTIIYKKSGKETLESGKGIKVTMLGGKVDRLMPSIYDGTLIGDTDIRVTGGAIRELSTGGESGDRTDKEPDKYYGPEYELTKIIGNINMYVGGNAVVEGIYGGHGDFEGKRTIHITDNAKIREYQKGTGEHIGKLYAGTCGGEHKGDTLVVVDGNAVVDGLFGGGYINSSKMNLLQVIGIGNVEIIVKGNAKISNFIFGGGLSDTKGSTNVKVLENASIKREVEKSTRRGKIYMGGVTVMSSIWRNAVLEIDTDNIDLSDVEDAEKIIIGSNTENKPELPYSEVDGVKLIVLSEKANRKLRNYIDTKTVDCIMVRPDNCTKNVTAGSPVTLGMKSTEIFDLGKNISQSHNIKYKWFKDNNEINGENSGTLSLKAEEGTNKYRMEVRSGYYKEDIILTTTEFTVTGTKASDAGGSTGGGSTGGEIVDIPIINVPSGEIPVIEVTEPVLKGDEDIKGWKAINAEIALCKEKGSYEIEMNKTTKVPAELFDIIAEKDIEVIFDLENGVEWKVNGKNVPNQEHNEVDLEMELKEAESSKDIQEEFKGNKLYRLSATQKSEFGFSMTMIINMEDVRGKIINLFDNEKKQNLLSVGKFGDNNKAELTVSKGMDYFIAVGDNAIIDKMFEKTALSAKSRTLYLSGTTGKTYKTTVKYPSVIKEAIDKGIVKTSVSYKTSNKKTATVSKAGVVTAKKKGNATITTTIKIGNLTKTLKSTIVVKKAYITLNKKTSSMKTGKKYSFSVRAYGYRLSDVKWSSSNKKVITIGKTTGKAEAKAKGTAYITAEVKGNSKRIKVVVK